MYKRIILNLLPKRYERFVKMDKVKNKFEG